MNKELDNQLWEYAWANVEEMEWDQLRELAGYELMWTDDDFEMLQEAAAEALYQQLKKTYMGSE